MATSDTMISIFINNIENALKTETIDATTCRYILYCISQIRRIIQETNNEYI